LGVVRGHLSKRQPFVAARIELAAAQRNEQISSLERARVDGYPVDDQAGVTRDDPSRDRGCDPSKRQTKPAHPTRDFTRRASNASRATAASSNGMT